MPKRRSTQRAHYTHAAGFTVSIMAGTKKIRGRPIVLPAWWLEEVNVRFADLKASGRVTLASLAADLTKAIKRELGWDHRAVMRFLTGKTTTWEMMAAFLLVWPSLVQPVFVAKSKRDAERITDELRRGDPNPEWRARYLEVNEELTKFAAPVLGHTDDVESINEVEVGRGEHRGTGHRRRRSVD